MRRGAVLAGVAALTFLVAGCGSGEEPAGLSTEPGGTASSTPTPSGDATETDGGEGGADGADEPPTEPSVGPTFVQPYLQAENIVEPRAEVPVEGVPDDATDEEAAAVRGYGRYYAAWEQVLWGVPVEQSGIERVAAGERLQAVRDYAAESVDLQRVTVGPPVSIHLLSVEVDGSAATVDVCIDTSERFDAIASAPPDVSDPMYRFVNDLELVDGNWLVTRAEIADDLAPCEGVFS